jgi:hypothetical protein
MIERNPELEQVEFRVVVGAERAKEFQAALAELAVDFGGSVVLGETEKPERLSLVESSETLDFNQDMATEIYEDYPNKKTWTITKNDLHDFAADHKFDGTLASRAFNAIMRELSWRSHTQNTQNNVYLAKGFAVQEPTDTDSSQPAVLIGLRVDCIAQVEAELASERINGYSTRSKELMKQFVEELFKPTEG